MSDLILPAGYQPPADAAATANVASPLNDGQLLCLMAATILAGGGKMTCAQAASRAIELFAMTCVMANRVGLDRALADADAMFPGTRAEAPR